MSQEDVMLSQDPCQMVLSQNMSGVQLSQISQNQGGVQMSQIQCVRPLPQMPQNLNALQVSQNAGSLRYFTSNVAGTFQGSGNQCMPGVNQNYQVHGNHTLQGHIDHPNYQHTSNNVFQGNQCFVGNTSTQVYQDNVSRNPIFTKDLLSCHDLSKN